MIESPFLYKEWLTSAEYEKLGQLSIQWSSIEHVIGNCLRVMLGLSDEEALIVVFPLTLERRLDHLKQLAKLKLLHPDAETALNELIDVMRGIQYVRNNVVHAIVTDDSEGGAALRLHSKQRSLTVEQIFSTEELTNYAAHAALALRFALGFDSGDSARHPLPDRPDIPEFLRELIPIRKK